MESLSGYAPELNPPEWLWANLKGVKLADLAGDTSSATLDEVIGRPNAGIRWIQATPDLPFWFLRRYALSLASIFHEVMRCERLGLVRWRLQD